MVIIAKFKPGYHSGQKIVKTVVSIETVFDARGGNYYLITVEGEDRAVETWQLEWYNLFNMPHQIEARRQIAKTLREL